MADGVQIGHGYIAISASARDAVRQIDREFSTAMPKAGERGGKHLGGGLVAAASKFAAPLAAVFAGAKIFDFGKEAIGAGSDLQQSLGGVQAVFGKFAGDIGKSSKAAAQNVGLSQNAFNELAATLGSTLKNKGIKDYAGQTKSLINIGSDLSAQFGGSTKEAVEALSSVLRGETDPIERYGVSINQAAISAEAMRLGLVKTTKDQSKITAAQLRAEVAQRKYNAAVKEHGKDSTEAKSAQAGLVSAQSSLTKAVAGSKVELNNQQKSMAALSLVSRQTKDAQGAFARESDTLAGKQQRVTAQWEDMKAKLGTALLPILSKVMGFINETGLPALSALAGMLQNRLGPAFGAVGKFIGPALDTIKLFFGTLTGQGADVDLPWMNKVIDLAEGVSDAFHRLVPAIQSVSVWIQSHLVPAFLGIVGAGQRLAAVVLPIIKAIATEFLKRWPVIAPVIKSIFQTIGGIVVDVMGLIQHEIATVTAVIKFIWSKWGKQITTIVGSIFETVYKVIAGAMKIVGGIVKVITGVMTGDWRKAGEGIKQIVGGIKQIVVAIWRNIQTQIQTILGSLIANLVNKFRGFLNYVGGSLRAGLAKIKGYVLDPIRAARDALKGVLDNIATKFRLGAAAVGRAWDTVKSKVKEPIRFVVNTVLEDGILGAFRKIAGLVGIGTGGWHVSLPRGFRTGGYTGDIDPRRVAGAVHGREYVLDEETTRKIGPANLDRWRAAVKAGKGGDLGFPGYSLGGYVKALSFAKKQVGKPYIFGSAGPAGFDCSGFMAAIQNVIEGKYPYQRRYSTPAFHGDHAQGFTRGKKSLFMVGVNPAPGKTGHMAGTLLGRNVESAGGVGVRVGGNARGYNNGMFSWRGGMGPGITGNIGDLIKTGFDSIKAWFESLIKGPLGKLANIGGGIVGDLSAGVARRMASGLTTKAATYDTGGWLDPGYTLAYNGTGQRERVLTGPQYAGGGQLVCGTAKLVGTNLEVYVEGILEKASRGV